LLEIVIDIENQLYCSQNFVHFHNILKLGMSIYLSTNVCNFFPLFYRVGTFILNYSFDKALWAKKWYHDYTEVEGKKETYVVGSSRKIREGLLKSSKAIDNRFRCPPESC